MLNKLFSGNSEQNSKSGAINDIKYLAWNVFQKFTALCLGKKAVKVRLAPTIFLRGQGPQRQRQKRFLC